MAQRDSLSKIIAIIATRVMAHGGAKVTTNVMGTAGTAAGATTTTTRRRRGVQHCEEFHAPTR